MAGYRIKLVRKVVENVNYQQLGAFRLRIEASDPTDSGMDTNVFLYFRRPLNPYDGSEDDDFHAVASPVDLAYYPVGEPRIGTAYPGFRLPYVEIDLRTTDLATLTWEDIVVDVDNLLQAMNRLEALSVAEEIWIGAALEDGGSSSSASAP